MGKSTGSRGPRRPQRAASADAEDLLARLISYTDGGARPMTDAQYRAMSERMAQLELEAAGRDLDQRELLRQWEAYQRRHRRGRAAGCFGRVLALPGCLAIFALWLLLSGGFITVVLLGLGALLLSRGGDLGDLARLPQALGLGPASPDGRVPLPPAPGTLALGGGALLTFALIATVIVRSTLRSVVGLVALLAMLGLAAAALIVLAQSGALDALVNALPSG